MQLLDFYTGRFGTAVKRQGNGWNGPCPLCGGEPGKSDRFVVWPERSESLGETCASRGITGIWSCRQCGASGDTIAYLMKVDGLDFKAALAELGIEGGRPSHRRRRAPAELRSTSWEPRQYPAPSRLWSEYAAKLLDEAEERIRREEQALRWLVSRGIDARAVKAYRIGYLPAEGGKYPGRWRSRSALGLEPRVGDDGKLRDKIFIPRGIVIPTLAADGRVLNLRIRRRKEDLNERSPKYLELEGSCKGPLLLRPVGQPSLSAVFVTEAELDAMLIHHVSGGVVGAVAVRTNRGKPDAPAHTLLRNCVRICIALDYDEAGAEGVDFWEKTYSSALRWLTPEGKDPGDAFRLGVDIREWIAAALPDSIALPDAGQADTLSSGRLENGGKGPVEAPPLPAEESISDRMRTSEPGGLQDTSEALFTADELSLLRAALPAYLLLEDVPPAVRRAFLLWRGARIRFCKIAGGGFSWDYDRSWARSHADRFEAFWRFQDKSTVLWEWLSAHVETEISSRNVLHIWG